jgi:hypothetical protein
VVGYLSDHLHSRPGDVATRFSTPRPPAAIAVLVPLESARRSLARSLLAYFLVVSVLVRVFVAVNEI